MKPSVHNRIEEGSKEIEEKYQNLVNNINDLIFTLDLKGNILFINNLTKKFTGFAPEEMIGHSFTEYVHPDDIPGLLDNIRLLLRGETHERIKGIDQDSECRMIKMGGEISWICTRSIPIEDAEGRIIGFNGIARDITDRKRAEKALAEAQAELERKVEERTAELTKANKKLRSEIKKRKKTEKALQERERELETRSTSLEETNTALKVLLERGEGEQTEFEKKVLFNMNEFVLPYLENLKESGLDKKQRLYTAMLESNISNILSPHSMNRFSIFANLTPMEIQVANLIQHGKTTKYIANLLNLSPRTIEVHRGNIRKKFGMKNKKTNLRSYLISNI